MNKWWLWLSIGIGISACGAQEVLPASDDDDEQDDGTDGTDDEDDDLSDDDEATARVDAGRGIDAGRRDAGTSRDAGARRDAGSRRGDAGSVDVLCEDDAGTGSGKSGDIGDSCAADGDCGSVGAGAKCLTTVALPFGGASLTYPGGYCTTPCTSDDVCGDVGACPLAMAGSFAADLSTCMKKCSSQADCRDGYGCSALPSFGGMAPTSTQKHCMPPSPFGGAPAP